MLGAAGLFNQPSRQFSAKKEASTDDIFTSADYFQQSPVAEVVTQSHEYKMMPWQDLNDTLGTF